MSEFEKQLNNEEQSFSVHGHIVPTDFSEEDVTFAQELDALFDLDKEELPPYFAQTLLEPEDPRFQVVEHGFEHKTRARVFRRLNLRRRLFHSPPFLTTLGSRSVQRSMLVLIAASLLFMLFTMAFTRQSFIEGVAVLLHGNRVGVYQVHSYPSEVSHPSYASNAAQPTMISLQAAQQRLHFPMYWPEVTPNNYVLDSMNLYQQPRQSWADGPILELEYDYTPPGSTTHNASEIAIREFKPNAAVLQVVEADAVQLVQVNAKGNNQAIYINGQWVSLNRYSHHWVYGGRSELIYQRNGVVFWIVSDQRDGVGKDVLLQVAQSLQVVNTTRITHTGSELGSVTQLVEDSSALFAGDIIAVLPDDSLSGPYITVVGTDQPLQEKPIQRHLVHVHSR
jgi:hypothetical protein